MSEIKNSGLDQYGAEFFEQQPFGTTGIEGVNGSQLIYYRDDDFSQLFIQCLQDAVLWLGSLQLLI